LYASGSQSLSCGRSRGEFGHEGDDRTGVERHEEDIRLRCGLPVERETFRRRDGCDPAGAEIRPDQPRIDQPEVRRDDQPVDLAIGRIGDREHGPVSGRALVIGLHLDAPDDAVGSRCRLHLKTGPLVAIDLDSAREVDGRFVARDGDRIERPGG